MRLPTAHFLRRRQTAILATFFGLLGGACALVLLLPVSYVARANLVSNGPGYDGSAELYAEQLDNERPRRAQAAPVDGSQAAWRRPHVAAAATHRARARGRGRRRACGEA